MKAIVDIGKTHVKLIIVSESNSVIQQFYTNNSPQYEGQYPHANTDAIWDWLSRCFLEFGSTQLIKKIIFTTHGATAALINAETNSLVLPILDYEYQGVEALNHEYENHRPKFTETFSPNLPAGLNLGRQFFWQSRTFPEQFSFATHILLYPQYWAWRLTGSLSSECTSLGCHTDLWQPAQQNFSCLVTKCGWTKYFPDVSALNKSIGSIKADVSEQTGLPADCQVYPGIHDSNASFLRYLYSADIDNEAFTVISTGTWTILMQSKGDLTKLNENKDMLANVNIYNAPVCCARFMGGREYELICEKLGGHVDQAVLQSDVQKAVNQLWMVTPDFSQGNGPFGGREPELFVSDNHDCAEAVASLYCALMIDQRLDDLQARGPIFIEGAFLKNTQMCSLIAQLRPSQSVYLSADNTGTVLGAAYLMDDNDQIQQARSLSLKKCSSAEISKLSDYKKRWNERVAQ